MAELLHWTPQVLKRMIREMPTETIAKMLFTVDEFHRMGDLGILPDHVRFELIRGEIIEMATPGPPHAGRVDRLNRLFTSKLGESAIVRIQNPFLIGIHSEALPDVAILKAVDSFYQTRHPGPEDVLLLVEVSHSTVSYDGRVKSAVYAECGVPEYWQLDVNKGTLIVRTHPQNGAFENTRIYQRGETVAPGQTNCTFTVDEMLGPLDSNPPEEK